MSRRYSRPRPPPGQPRWGERCADPPLPQHSVETLGARCRTLYCDVMANRALLVGTNGTSAAPLYGCIQDARRTGDLLIQFCDFAANEIRLLPGDQASAGNLRNELRALVDGAQAGDRVLFMFSGHGTRLRSPEDAQFHDAICPSDFDGTSDKVITALEFERLFSQIPDDVIFTWISDSCHSGDLAGDPQRGTPRVEPTLVAPDVASRSFADVMAQLPGAFLAACGSAQDAREDEFSGVWQGAFTFYLLSRLAYRITDPLSIVVTDVQEKLHQYQFTQVPILGGSPAAKQRPFLR